MSLDGQQITHQSYIMILYMSFMVENTIQQRKINNTSFEIYFFLLSLYLKLLYVQKKQKVRKKMVQNLHTYTERQTNGQTDVWKDGRTPRQSLTSTSRRLKAGKSTALYITMPSDYTTSLSVFTVATGRRAVFSVKSRFTT